MMTSGVAAKVTAEMITYRISCSCLQRGQLDRVVCPQSGLSESGEGEDTGHPIVGFEWGGICQHETKRTRIQNSRASDVHSRLHRCHGKYLQAKNQKMKWRRWQCEIKEERGGATERRGWGAYLLACRQFFFRAGAVCTRLGVSLWAA